MHEAKFVKNRKGNQNLVYKGFVYRKKAQYKNTINWVCAKAPTRDHNNRLILCYGRCVTDDKNHIRLSKKGHNHSPNSNDIDMLDYPKDDLLSDDVNYGSYFIEKTECDLEWKWGGRVEPLNHFIYSSNYLYTYEN